jgi:ligand-binding SRPBCC domain-containing protein
MPIIELTTYIKSNIETCFDLSTSIDLHKISTIQTNEEAIAGTTKGLIKLNEFVTWQATHFGIKQKLTSKITAYERPYHFRDEQIRGIFKSIKHDHFFEQNGDEIMMKDIFEFDSPCGIFGRIFNKLILTKYLTKFLIARNNLIKEFAETEKHKMVLSEK